MGKKNDWDRGYEQAEKDLEEAPEMATAENYPDETALFVEGFNHCLKFNGWLDEIEDPYNEEIFYDVDATGSCFSDADPGL